jgi:hypothetical protein
MTTIAVDATNGIESELLDIGTVPLSALSRWRCAAMREAMADASKWSEYSQVCDNTGGGMSLSTPTYAE